MRSSLRSQIQIPLLGVMLTAMICVSIANAWLAARRTHLRLETQLREVAQTLAEATFPLTDAVLRQARGLSGAEFAVVDERGQVVAASAPRLAPPGEPFSRAPPVRWQLDETVTIGEATFFHARVKREPRRGDRETQWVYIFYPVQQWRQVWREAAVPPLLVGGAAIAVMAVVASWLAGRLAHPIVRLRAQVERMARGDFQPLPLPPRDDEIRALAAAVNRMAEMLAKYEEEVRRRERLRTLGQLGGGIAHQMRNAATGCRMAIDLHRRGAPTLAADENLAVAVRQLELMETYLRRFLTLGAEHTAPHAEVDMVQVVDDILPLVRPMANHLRVALRWTPPPAPMRVRGDETGLAQLAVNLTLNAIEAAASGGGSEKMVELRLAAEGDGATIRLEVIDSGPGPAPAIRERLFEPLVSDKPDGAGLGLSVAREIVQLHRGDIRWERRDARTHFMVELPALAIANAAGSQSK